MSKVLKKVVKIGAVVAGIALAIPTGGGSLLAVGLGVSALGAVAIAGGLALASSLLSSKPKSPETSPADRDRLFANIDPRTPRKIVYGRTAMATDIRDQEFSGSDDEFFHRFLVVASHKVNSIDEIWFDDKLAWTSIGGVQGEFVGYLTVATRTEGSAANAINISSRMGSTRRYTGLAYVHFRYKLTGNNSKTTSPFAQAIPTRVTIIGNGMELYDPRLDSTRGGAGAHRIDDQSTWTWDDDACRNPALQLLNYLIGYRINGQLAVGKGIPPERIDIDSFAVAANACDEPVTLAAGGTEPRYRTDGIFSEADDMELVINQYKSSMNAITDDAGGKIRVVVLVNDLASPIADFNEDDILSPVDWKPGPDLGDRFNSVRGTHTDPSNNSLYQGVDYPEKSLPSPDGIDRVFPVDFPLVHSASQCERLANQRLQRAQYSGMFSFTGGERYWKVLKNDVLRQTFGPLGMTNKLFRVVDITLQDDGTVPIVLREENSAVYAWDQDETAALQPAAPDTYDYTLNPLYQDIVQLGDDVLVALDLAAARGKLWVQASAPGLDESNVGDTWINEDTGVFYDRVAPTIKIGVLGVASIGGKRLSSIWNRSVGQPLEDVIAAADEAQATANSAQSRVQAYDDDGVLDISEKRRLIVDNQQFEDAYDEILVSAATVGVSSTNLATARSTYIAFRDAITPAWDDTSQDSPVTRNSLDTVINNYAAAIQALRKDIEESVQALADAAESRAQTAEALANSAQAGAAAANTILADIASDNVLTPDEKPSVILNYDVIIQEQAGIEASADVQSITTEKTAYTAAITALTDHLATLTIPVLWSVLSGNTNIVGPTFRLKFSDVYAARQVLLNAIAAKIQANISAGLNPDGTVKDDKVDTPAIIAGALTAFIFASCVPATRFYDGSIDEVCNITVSTVPTGSVGIRVQGNGDFKNNELGPIESHIRLYKIPAADVAAYQAYRDANGGEMGIYAAVPLQSDMLQFAANVWDNFSLNYVDASAATGDMYVCGLDAVSNMNYQHKEVQMTVEVIKR